MQCADEKTVVNGILLSIKSGANILHMNRFYFRENSISGTYMIGHPVIGHEEYAVWFAVKEEYAKVRYSYDNNADGITIESLIEAAGQDQEDAYDYSKAVYLTTPLRGKIKIA